jgi:hypothetical protein
VPICATSHVTSSAAYGAIFPPRSPSAARSRHAVSTRSPTNGIFATHSGGTLKDCGSIDFAQFVMSPTCETSVPRASASGTRKISDIAVVITATASQRRRQRRFCTASIVGHVATAIIVAQINAGKNGFMIQSDDAISRPTIVMTRIERNMSGSAPRLTTGLRSIRRSVEPAIALQQVRRSTCARPLGGVRQIGGGFVTPNIVEVRQGLRHSVVHAIWT